MSDHTDFDMFMPPYGDIGDPPKVQEPPDDAYTDHPGNGVDVTTGRLLMPELLVQQMRVPDELPGELKEMAVHAGRDLAPGIDSNDLSQTGWGVIVRQGAGDAVLEALKPLLELREEQAGFRFRKIEYQPGESALQLLARYDLGPDVVDPDTLPYYLLIAGTPEDVPFRLQYPLATGYGVGRLSFDDPQGYRNYAEGAVRCERDGVRRPRAVSLFSVATDETTERMTNDLVGPLMPRLVRPLENDSWSVRSSLRHDATKGELRRLCGGAATPAVLVTACHGAIYPAGDAQQAARQGALICQGWKGRGHEPQDDVLFTAADVADDADVSGLVCLMLSCFSAGTPDIDDFSHEQRGPQRLAPEAMISALPQRLLGHPGGGALAVLGHVDRAWTTTGMWTRRGGQVQTLAAVLRHILAGNRVGHAAALFGRRYARIAAHLAQVWDEVIKGGDAPKEEFHKWLWTAHTDARNTILLGDPAARSRPGADA